MILIGNWKMAPEKQTDAITLFKKTLALARTYKSITFVSCVPSFHLPFLAKQSQKTLSLGGQDISGSTEIAHTGLVNAGMLKSYGGSYCIVGHSEQRALGKTDEQVSTEIQTLLQKKIIPIICVGERERDAHGWYLSAVKEQVEKALSGLTPSQVKSLIIAYEPVWAIGKHAVREATPLECREMVIFIRRIIADSFGEKESQKVTIVYGGSVNETNATSFVTEGGVQGFLVGRISIEPTRFGKLAKQLSLVKLSLV